MVRLGVAAGLASGLLLWASSPAVGAGWVAWVALVPAAVAALRWPAAAAGRIAVPLAYGVYLELMLVPALPFGLADGQFAETPVPVLIAGSPVLLIALMLVPALCAGLYALRFGQAPVRSSAVVLVAVPALAFTALDFVRVKADPGGFFGPLFLSQHDAATARLGDLAGPWLLTLAIAAVAYALALALVRRRALLAATGATALLAGGVAVAVAGPASAEDGGVVVAAVQPGYDTSEDDRPELRFFTPGSYQLAALDTIRDLGGLTRRAARAGAELVVWPEAGIWVDPVRTPAVRAELARLSREAGAAIVVPYFLRSARQGAVVVVTPDGAISTPRAKQRPVWFLGEDGGNRTPARPLRSGPVTVGTMLGVDNQDPGLAAALRRRGAEVLVSSTHDWGQMAVYQRAFAQLHAAAGIPVIRADWRYGSAIYDSGGHEVADAGSAKRRAVLTARVSPAGGSSPYAAIGDALGWLALAVTALLAPLRLASYDPG